MAKRLLQLYTGIGLAEQYARFRPTYNPAIFDFMFKYYEEGKGPNCNRELAVDVGCGSGQATLPLASYFRTVIGCDSSKDQLRHAPKYIQGVRFRECASEDLNFLQAQSTDMITAATAFHWFDLPLFYKEVERVLKPGGVLAMFTYGWLEAENKEVADLQQQFVTVTQKYDVHVLDLSSAYAGVLKNSYEGFSLPFPGWQRIDREFDIRKEMTASDLIGYYRSEHMWWPFLEDNPNSNFLEILQNKMEAVLGDKNSKMDVTFPVFLLLGRKPV